MVSVCFISLFEIFVIVHVDGRPRRSNECRIDLVSIWMQKKTKNKTK